MSKKCLSTDRRPGNRHASILVLAAVMLTAIVGLLAVALDVGYIVLVRSQLQVAADAAALAGASCLSEGPQSVFLTADRFAHYHTSGGQQLAVLPEDVALGFWDPGIREFVPEHEGVNAVRVRVRRSESTGHPAPLFFARVFGKTSTDLSAEAVAATLPRDIAFVVDVSESMNDETEPAWACDILNQRYSADGHPTIGSELIQRVYDDFGFGTYPGPLEHLGQPWGVSQNEYAFSELADDDGPLSRASVPDRYRIRPGDDASTRKTKAYSAIIDYQIARLMPNAKPIPSSRTNYAYWEKYLDYVIVSAPLKTSTSGRQRGRNSSGNHSQERKGHGDKQAHSLTSASERRGLSEGHLASISRRGNTDERTRGSHGRQPKGASDRYPRDENGSSWSFPQTGDHITKMHNPNQQAFPDANSQLPTRYANKIGYLTYVQFMMDYGRDLKPDGLNNVPLSRRSPDCPYHTEATPAGYFRFPPREEPTHSIRRALITAIQLLKQRNESLPAQQCDWVSIIAFDTPLGGSAEIIQPLTPDFDQAMLACTRLQACGDKGLTSNLEAGLIAAREHLRSGDAARPNAHKVVVVLTDGLANSAVSTAKDILAFVSTTSDSAFPLDGNQPQLAAMMQVGRCRQDGWSVFPIGVGVGANWAFIDQLARLSGNTGNNQIPDNVASDPVDREQRIVEILKLIIDRPPVRLVQ